MNKEQYLKQRNLLIEKAQGLLNENKFEEFNSVKAEIEKLDTDFENAAKEQANLNALKDNAVITDINNKSVQVGGGTVIDSFNADCLKDEKKDTIYTNAWAKSMQGKQLTEEENQVFTMVNEAFTHTSENTAVVIPETVMTGIWKEVGEQYPLWNDVLKTTVPGKVTLLKSDSSSDSKWYDEGTETEDGKETFANVTLDGCELSRDITISWKLKEMATEEFIPFIQSQLVEKMGAALGYAVSQGKGKPGDGEEFKPEPSGIITTLNKEKDTPQVITYTTKDPLSYAKFTTAMSKIKGTYKNGTCIYANGTTIWSEIANITDKNDRPYFVANPVEGGVGTILGKVVKEDDGIPDSVILLGDANKGYHANINKQATLDSEDHKKKRETDYIAYAIVDGGVRSTKAFALIKKTDEVSNS